METESMSGKLQIYSVEERLGDSTVCVVRCVGGVVRPGRQFTTAPPSDAAEADQHVTLEEIYRYGATVDFIDPPHNAKVVFSGPGVTILARGVTLVSEEQKTPGQ
ncbi:hypothetical protein ABZS79_32640 [Streptomyces griseoloalbus]|uniref:hypothetical protein n=1 Tax=Streptomyces griseoloalbus TaxID=67303 RepID=UPI0033B1B32F